MKIYRPLWEDGAFLAPQQFQQQARWDAHVADTVARMALANPWGVLCAEFDEGALALSRLNATRLCVRFADGTLVDTDLADNLPPVCDLSAAGSDAVEVLLCLPLLSANGGNLDDGQDSARPRRWQSERVTVQELAGHERSELTVLRHALTLRLSTQENSAWLTCPVARLMRNAQGQWVLERSFIPPLLSLSASPLLLSELSDLLHRLAARRKRLMAMRRESNERMADFAVADVSLFWLLNALNSVEPVLTELHQAPSRQYRTQDDERREDVVRALSERVEIAGECIFDIPLNDMEAVRPYGELDNSDVQPDPGERDGSCKSPFRSVHGVKNYDWYSTFTRPGNDHRPCNHQARRKAGTHARNDCRRRRLHPACLGDKGMDGVPDYGPACFGWHRNAGAASSVVQAGR